MIKYFLLTTVFIFTSVSYSQFNLYTGYEGIYDDNIFNNYLNTSDFINVFSLGAAYDFESEINNVQIYYEGNFADYQTNKTKSFNAHRIGLVETHLFSEDLNPLNAGINYSFRNNRDDFTFYDYNQLSGYINYRHGITETDFILAGYIFNRNDYPNFTVFSNNEHKAFLKWISSFQTRTSLMIGVEYNYKNYSEQYDFTDFANDASLLKLNLNISQSLAEFTGANVFFTYRKNLTDKSRYIVNDSLIFYEEELFNDLYSYDGFETGIGLTQLIGSVFKLSLEAKFIRRNYTSLYAADLFGNELNDLRKDDQMGIGLGIEYDLSDLLEGISFFAAYNYLNNSSNDPFYKYNNQIISFALEYGF